MRFRDEELTFKVSEQDSQVEVKTTGKEETKEEKARRKLHHIYPDMTKSLGPFKLQVQSGTFRASETIVMLGQNGTGKTTMIKMLAGLLKPDD